MLLYVVRLQHAAVLHFVYRQPGSIGHTHQYITVHTSLDHRLAGDIIYQLRYPEYGEAVASAC